MNTVYVIVLLVIYLFIFLKLRYICHTVNKPRNFFAIFRWWS